MRLLARFLVVAGAVWLVTYFVDGVRVTGGVESYLVVALLFAVVNVLVKPVLKLLAFPLLVLTLGLFLVVVNAALFGLVALLTERLSVAGIGPAVLASLLVSAVTWTGDNVLGLKRD